MEFCPRCTSTVADGAASCPSCGTALWQPAQIAVTPAPVALMPPVPPPAVADLPPTAAEAPAPQSPDWVPALATNSGLRSVAVTLPPQREAPTPAAVTPPSAATATALAAPPDAPERSTTVVPATPPPARKPNQAVIAITTVVPLLAVVVLIIALPARGAKPRHVPAVATGADVQLALRSLATAEETTLTATELYTTDAAALTDAGFRPAPRKPMTINAGVSKSGYCLLATAGGTAPWYLYDSKQGGLVSTSFAAESLAQQACADKAITTYQPIS